MSAFDNNVGLIDNPEPPDTKFPICPVCGMETDTFYRDIFGRIIGCDECVEAVDAWTWEDI